MSAFGVQYDRGKNQIFQVGQIFPLPTSFFSKHIRVQMENGGVHLPEVTRVAAVFRSRKLYSIVKLNNLHSLT
jgi:hypothetical protein